MKKILVLLMLTFLITVLNSQEKALVGVKAGVGFSSLTGDKWDPQSNEEFIFTQDKDKRTGYYLGGFLNYKFYQDFFVQPEVIFALKGAVLDLNDFGIDANYEFNLTYLDIPVLLGYEYNFTPNSSIILSVGPMVSLMLDSKVVFDENGATDEVTWDSYFDELANQTDIGILGSVGAKYKNYMLEFRMSKGYKNIFDSEPREAFNKVFSVGLGYTFTSKYKTKKKKTGYF